VFVPTLGAGAGGGCTQLVSLNWTFSEPESVSVMPPDSEGDANLSATTRERAVDYSGPMAAPCGRTAPVRVGLPIRGHPRVCSATPMGGSVLHAFALSTYTHQPV